MNGWQALLYGWMRSLRRTDPEPGSLGDRDQTLESSEAGEASKGRRAGERDRCRKAGSILAIKRRGCLRRKGAECSMK